MKTICRQGIVLVIILACYDDSMAQQNQQVKYQSKKEVNMTNEQTSVNKELIRKMYNECLNTRKLELLDQFIDENFVDARGEKGPAGFSKTINAMYQGFPDIHWNIEDMMAEGNQVVIRWIWNGTNTGQFRNWAASGKKVHDNGIAIYKIENNKVVSVSMQTDRLGFLQQIGVVGDIPGVPAPKE